MDGKQIIEYLPEGQPFTKNNFRDIIGNLELRYTESGITWLLSELKKARQINSIGKGIYIRQQKENKKRLYSYEHLALYREIEDFISQEYPLVTFQMWEIYQLNEFVNHLFGKNTIFVEVENMLESAVFETLHGKYPDVLFCPTEELYYRQRGEDNTIVVQRLLSEAPKPTEGHSVPLEKLLVDLFSNKLTGKIVSRSEYRTIYEDCFAKYDIDEIKMLRYARRRNLEDKIRKYLQEETEVKLHY